MTLQLFRLLLIGLNHEQIGTQTGADSLLAVVANGLRYDISTAASWVLPTFLLSLFTAFLHVSGGLDKLRYFSASLFAVVSILIFGVDLIFFSVYGDQLNQMIFGIVHDDTAAILVTIWKEYHPILFTVIAVPLILLNLRLVHRWMSYTPKWQQLLPRLQPLALKLFSGILIFLFVAAAARGGALWGQPLRLKHAFVVDDTFLNRTVLNPISALRYTLQTRLELEQGTALKAFWPKSSLYEAIDFATTGRGDAVKGSRNLDELLSVTASGYPAAKPKHIFVLLMESHSGWTVMPQYRFAGLSPEFSKLADEGIYFPNFLSSGTGTIGSLNAIITGLPDVGLNINYETSALTPYPSALAANMKRLGYKTRFFYGGYISWQRLDTFAHNQGFDEVYGGGSMKVGAHTNEWGVDDEYLFDYVLNTVDDETPSFNFILTTSNHPPYDLDLEGMGYHLKDKLPEPLKTTKSESVKVLGHLWYADRQAGRFVHEAEKSLEHPLFAITGDHTARLNIAFPGEALLQQLAVPFILYGPEVLPENGSLRRTAGSHLDIAPTLLELAAEPGYRYTAFGQSMLAKPSPSYGFGRGYVLGENFIARKHSRQAPKPIPGANLPDSLPLDKQSTRFDALNALGWYRVKKGAQLPERDNVTAKKQPQ